MNHMIRVLLIFCCLCPTFSAAAPYAVATGAVPVLNSPEVHRIFGGAEGRSLKVDRCGQVQELEYIALPGTLFRVVEEVTRGDLAVLKVETDDYTPAAGVGLYVDRRFVELYDRAPAQRFRTVPVADEVIAALRSSVGLPYVWGGNVRDGIPEMSARYYGGKVSAESRDILTLAGLDCSGLLYHATGGWTPRNTSQLVTYGTGVQVAGRGVDAIASLLRPLDLIAWKGHVLIVLDENNLIESRLECGYPGNGGVMVWPLRERLREIMRTRRPVDAWSSAGKRQDVFVVRRWLEQ